MRIILLLFFIFSTHSWAQESIIDSIKDSEGCLEMIPMGVCPKITRLNEPVGALVKIRVPSLIIETVKKPGDSQLPMVGSILSSIDKDTAGSSTGSLNGSNLQFNEVHIINTPGLKEFYDSICSVLPQLSSKEGIHYISELDSIAWRRKGVMNTIPYEPAVDQACSQKEVENGGQCMKSWGSLYPSEGFVIAPSEVMGSVVDAMRAVNITYQHQSPHMILSPLDFRPRLKQDRIQMFKPSLSRCLSIGENPQNWEKASPDGKYVWIYWNESWCCL